jgi:hypothetical protein
MNKHADVVARSCCFGGEARVKARRPKHEEKAERRTKMDPKQRRGMTNLNTQARSQEKDGDGELRKFCVFSKLNRSK